MVEMINRISGAHMWVAKERVSEYLSAGHMIVNREKPKAPKASEAEPVDFMNPPIEPVIQDDEPEKAAEPVKRGRGRGRAKK